MVDFHTHILPKIDDGSKSVEETEKLLSMLKEQGFKKIVSTSHFYANNHTPDVFLEKRQKAFDSISSVVDKSNFDIVLGAEVYYFYGMGVCEELKKLTIGDTNLILVEMPYGDWDDEVIADVERIETHLNLRVVFAHLDRFLQFRKNKRYIDYILDSNMLVQVNIDSFFEMRTKRKIVSWLRNGQIDILGSDCHNLDKRKPNWDKLKLMKMKEQDLSAIERIDEFSEHLLRNH